MVIPMAQNQLLFCLNQDVLNRFDGRWIGMNILDNGQSATIAQLTDPVFPLPYTGPALLLQNLIGDASEFLMSAAAVGARYAVTDLQTYGGNLLINITAGLSMGPILKRRSRPVTANKMISDAYTEAMQYIEQLRRGDRIFAMVPNVPQAGLPGLAYMTPFVPFGGPDVTQVTQRYFGNNILPGLGGYGINPYYYPPGPPS
jgi:hypothetical protein